MGGGGGVVGGPLPLAPSALKTLGLIQFEGVASEDSAVH